MSLTEQTQMAEAEELQSSPGLKKMPKKDDLHEVYAHANGHAPSSHNARMFVPKYKHVMAVHGKLNTSCLTHGAHEVSFAGFRNLMVLVIVVSNLRLMIENFRKYGVLICIACHDYRQQDLILGAILFFLVPCHLFIAYTIERFAAQQAMNAVGKAKKTDELDEQAKTLNAEGRSFRSSWHVFAILHFVNITLNLAIATNVVYFYIHHPGIGTLCEMHAVIVWLKTCSYAMTNRDLRHAKVSASQEPLPEIYKTCPYPQNITLNNLMYFWWAPTLVYQPVYPRTATIRWPFIFFRALEVIGLSIAIWIASAQYAVPLLRNSLPIISDMDIPQMLERLMKLSSISIFCWLVGFYAVFQSALNLLAELLQFGDRDFYEDWWNSPNLRIYWKNWNKPVYLFMKRHVFTPLVGRGCPPLLAQVIVFTFSAVLHELLVGVPTHNILGVAFTGMMFQIPLIAVTEVVAKMKFMGGKTIGNCIFWVSFVLVGQPLAALIYFFAWQAKYGSVSKPDIHAAWR